MLKMKSTASGITSPTTVAGGGGFEQAGWEMRPGGMLVQQRNSVSSQTSIPVPTIRIKVKYGSSFHEINISSQASFGELKKILAGTTGLHPQDQKLIYKDKERDSKLFLDVVGVKNGSKVVVIEDLMSRERRFLESQKNSKMNKALKDIAEIRLEVDKLGKQVANLESEIHGGKKEVEEKVLLNLIEVLMTQLIKLDGIIVDGDLKLQRRMQVKRVQKYIEILDMLKIRNSMLSSNGTKVPLQQQQPIPGQKQPEKKNSDLAAPSPRPVVVTTNWETFDSGVTVPLPVNSASTTKHNSTNLNTKFNWELL